MRRYTKSSTIAGRWFIAAIGIAATGILAGQAALADGNAAQYLFIADGVQNGLDISGDLTLEAWVKLNSEPSDEPYAIISKSDGATNDGSYELRYAARQLTLAISPDGNLGTYCTVPVELTVGTWHHIAAVYSASAGTCAIFENGTKVGVMRGLARRIHNADAAFRVGARDKELRFFFDGLIDDVRVWNRTRTAEEIAETYQKELAGTEEGLVGYWRLNESTNDLSGNSNNLINSSAAYSTDVPFGNEEVTISATEQGKIHRSATATPAMAATPAIPPLVHGERATPAEPAVPPFAVENNTHSVVLRNN